MFPHGWLAVRRCYPLVQHLTKSLQKFCTDEQCQELRVVINLPCLWMSWNYCETLSHTNEVLPWFSSKFLQALHRKGLMYRFLEAEDNEDDYPDSGKGLGADI